MKKKLNIKESIKFYYSIENIISWQKLIDFENRKS